MKIKLSSNEKKRTNQVHYIVVFGSAGFDDVHDAFVIPRNTRQVEGPSHFSGANGMPKSVEDLCIDFRDSAHASEPADPRVKKSSR